MSLEGKLKETSNAESILADQREIVHAQLVHLFQNDKNIPKTYQFIERVQQGLVSPGMRSLLLQWVWKIGSKYQLQVMTV